MRPGFACLLLPAAAGAVGTCWSGGNRNVQKFLIGGGTGNTSVLRTDGSYTFDEAMWPPWDVPAL